MPPTDPSIVYEWFDVGVLDYDDVSQQYLVQKVNRQGRVVDTDGKPIVNGGKRPDGIPSFENQSYSPSPP